MFDLYSLSEKTCSFGTVLCGVLISYWPESLGTLNRKGCAVKMHLELQQLLDYSPGASSNVLEAYYHE